MGIYSHRKLSCYITFVNDGLVKSCIKLCTVAHSLTHGHCVLKTDYRVMEEEIRSYLGDNIKLSYTESSNGVCWASTCVIKAFHLAKTLVPVLKYT